MSPHEVKIAPSVLSADFSRLSDQLRTVEQAGAGLLHIDVMDGHFVPNITIGPFVVETINRITDLSLDVHLMIEKPEKYIEVFAQAGADWISVHVETCRDLKKIIDQIRSLDIKAGAALNPDTSIDRIEEVLPLLDYVLVMSVFPGFSGQDFIPESLAKISRVKEMIASMSLKIKIEVDGGVNSSNAAEIAKAGADVLVAGNHIFKQEDIAGALKHLKHLVNH